MSPRDSDIQCARSVKGLLVTKNTYLGTDTAKDSGWLAHGWVSWAGVAAHRIQWLVWRPQKGKQRGSPFHAENLQRSTCPHGSEDNLILPILKETGESCQLRDKDEELKGWGNLREELWAAEGPSLDQNLKPLWMANTNLPFDSVIYFTSYQSLLFLKGIGHTANTFSITINFQHKHIAPQLGSGG